MPFIANNGQTNERVKFYANTFGGTVFVTKDGEIVYSLPMVAHASPLVHYDIDKNETGYTGLTGYRGKEGQCVVHRTLCTLYPYCPWNFPVYYSEINSPLKRGTHPLIPSREGNGVCNTTPTTRRDTERRVPTTTVALKEQFVGAKVKTIQGEQPSVTKVNYFKGSDPEKWKTDISTYDMVNLGEIYKGIDLKLKAYGANVEKLFYVKPGADPDQIRISLSGTQPPESPFIKGDLTKSPLEKGARGLLVNELGELEVETELGPVKFTKPVAYQEINGKRVDVSVEYRVGSSEAENKFSKHKTCNSKLMSTNPKSEIQNLSSTSIGDPQFEYGFKVASYDKSHDLIIDPLLASTYLGGSGEDYGYSLALDTSGNVYVTGYTWSTDFPTTSGAYDTSSDTTYTDVFVSKMDGGLTNLLASTYLGGSYWDIGYAITLDTSGNVYVTGDTQSTDFPTTSGAYDTSYNAYNDGSGNDDVFVSKLDSGLTSLLASTYLGGSGREVGRSLTLDTSGNVYVTGNTASTDFPTTSSAYDTSFNGGCVFISKLNSGLTSLLASTNLGGSGSDVGMSLTLDTSGHVYVTGYTVSSDFPTTSGAYDTSFNGGGVFISKLDGGLTSLPASTFLGGSNGDQGYSLTLDTSGNVYVTGVTWSSDFPTTVGAYDTSYNGGNYDAFVSKLNSGLSSLLASTYLGGSGSDVGWSLTLDSSGNVYVTGGTASTDFPTTSSAYDTSFGGDSESKDAYVSKLDSGLTSLLASTYLGASASEGCFSLALDTSGDVYMTGATYSKNFPTTSGAYDTSFNSRYSYDSDVFVSKLDGNLSASPTPTPSPSPTPTPAICSDSYEPNDSSTQAYGYLTSGFSYSGKICSSSDVDWFKVNITTKGTISVNLTVPSSKDYYVELYGPSYTWVAGNHDVSISYNATTTGTYYIRVLGYNGSYNTTSSYTLTYKFTPISSPKSDLVVENPSVSPSRGKPGTSATVSFTIRNQGSGSSTSCTTNIRFNTSSSSVTTSDKLLKSVNTPSISPGSTYSISESVTIPSSSSSGTYYIWVIADVNSTANQSDVTNDKAKTSFYVETTTIPTPSPTPTPSTCSDSYEPNDNSSKAYGPLTSGSIYSGKICSESDVDWFKVNITTKGTISVNLTVPSSKDYDLELYDPSYAWIAGSYSSSTSESISKNITTAGIYYIRISGSNGSYSTTSSYTLTFTFTSLSSTPSPTATPSPIPTPSPTTSPKEEKLLEKHAPILYMHPDERFYPTNAQTMLDNSELWEKGTDEPVYENDKNDLKLKYLMKIFDKKKYYLKLKEKSLEKIKNKNYWREKEKVVYGRQFKANDNGIEKIVLQYWFFYIYNDWGKKTDFANVHEGDWEMVQIVLNSDEQPEITYSYHEGGKTLEWVKDKDEIDKSNDGNHPKVYVTLGGHGSWNKAGNHAWYQKLFGVCQDCEDETKEGDVLYPPNFPEDEIQTNYSKYPYKLVDMSDWTEKDWIYWKGYWGNQKGRGFSGPPSPVYIDYIKDDEYEGRWKEPFKWADEPLPENYNVCSSNNSKIIVYDLNGNIMRLFKKCSPSVFTINSEKDLVFDVYSLDGEEVNLNISRFKRTTGEVFDVEFDWLKIPRKGKATLRFSPDENPNLEMEIDHDHNGIFDYRVLPDYATQNP